jgi:glycosyltransferase involved in cell wall biosynthesis
MALATEAARAAGIELKVSTDLTRDLPHARAMLYLTQSEGLGSGVLLAMAHGVSVVASNIGGIPELIEDGVHGVLVGNETEEIVAGLRRLDPSMGRAARERVREQFTEERMIEQTLAAYGDVKGTR